MQTGAGAESSSQTGFVIAMISRKIVNVETANDADGSTANGATVKMTMAHQNQLPKIKRFSNLIQSLSYIY